MDFYKKWFNLLISKYFYFVIFIFLQIHLSASEIEVFSEKQSAQIQFAVTEINKSLISKGERAVNLPLADLRRKQLSHTRIVFLTTSNQQLILKMRNLGINVDVDLKPEGFYIRTTGGKHQIIWIVGKDEAGAMYGGLEVAEIIDTQGMSALVNMVQNPHMTIRGVKFNIPLDVRTPSYSDVSDAAQKNMAEMWNLDFWKEYIDNLARFRYNCISLWNLHPFPSMVKVPEYPDVALNNVHKSTTSWKENYNLNGIGFDDSEIVNRYEVIKKITIDEKIAFWQQVMKYGTDRNVHFYIVTWNIFTYGTFGKYGITDKLENPITIDYFRKSVRQLFLTYPNLTGVGFTTGENMYAYSSPEKEDWAFETYGKGILDVLKEQPQRKITLIHRQHQTGTKEIASKFAPVIGHPNVNFLFSFKYAQAHVYSSVNQVFHQGFVKDVQETGRLKTLWTLRNDDIFHFRWGAPDFVREFIKNIPTEVSEGYYYGSDQYVWGREFMDINPETPRQLEISKHWYQWMLWGRLGYHPDINNQRFVQILKSRFPETDAAQLFDAWQHASMIYPITTGFHWGALDFQWYIESGQSRSDPAQTPSGYHDINRFITLPPHKGTGYMSIPDYVSMKLSGKKIPGITPPEVAMQLITHTSKSLGWANKIEIKGNPELARTRDDIQSMAYLGNYYASKINAATQLALFRESLIKEYRDSAFVRLNESAMAWRKYASMSLSNYRNPLWTNRVGHVDWRKTFSYALYDITSNGGKLNLSSMNPSSGGTILEAENANYNVSVMNNSISGFTGTGYLVTKAGDARHQITWKYTAPDAGMYLLEFRYTLTRQELFSSPVVVNGKTDKEIIFWMTGSPGCWVWDRTTVYLEKGENTIFISPEGFVVIDHLNVLRNF